MKHFRHHYRALVTGSLAIILLLTLGTAVYQSVEGWSMIDALYFTASTLTTVGYGDIVPQTEIGKIFTIIYMFSGIGVVLIVLATFGTAYMRSIESLSRKEPKYQKSLWAKLKHKYRYR